jgi:hypothetical protein
MKENEMQTVTEFFTFTSILALGGASVGALVVTNTLRKVFGWNPIMVCFLISLAICFVGAYQVERLTQIGEVVITFINSCLLFCTTTGMQEFGGSAVTGKPVGTAEPQGRGVAPPTASWLH